ncbi:MAG: exo-beta-N-acetylmuramidase NamZ domain-containing protein [Clostridium sp.]|uniref:exo-beta-N-acetylmuramidase NamZ domain-containing protein n=1 Tax=Clostridium sp. TaxID=1506 RepID=UPI003D6CBA32
MRVCFNHISEDDLMIMELTAGGTDNLEEYTSIFEGKRLGLITGPTGVNKKLVSTIDILHKKYNLVALFSHEHGVCGWGHLKFK